jgi:hypothetical protein
MIEECAHGCKFNIFSSGDVFTVIRTSLLGITNLHVLSSPGTFTNPIFFGATIESK